MYISVTTDQLLRIFCLSEVLRVFFFPFPQNCVYCMNTEDKGFCRLKKGLFIKDLENAHSRTLCRQDYSSSCSAALCSLWGRDWEQGCSCGCFATQFAAWPCLWVRNTMLCRSPEIVNNLGKVKGKCGDCAYPR